MLIASLTCYYLKIVFNCHACLLQQHESDSNDSVCGWIRDAETLLNAAMKPVTAGRDAVSSVLNKICSLHADIDNHAGSISAMNLLAGEQPDVASSAAVSGKLNDLNS